MSMPSDPLSKDELERYLAGELSPEDSARMQRHLRAHPGRRGLVAGVQAMLRGGAFGATPDIAGARQRFLRRLAEEGRMPPKASRVTTQSPISIGRWTSPRSWVTRPFAIAAGIAALGAAVVLWATSSRNHASPQLSYATVAGQRAIIRLPDGSRVTLAPRSRLQIDQGRDGARRATLVGEARFEIVSDRRAPFLVVTGPVTTQVLGTTFDVRRYDDDPDGSVAVLSGKVRTSTSGHAVTLMAGMAGTFTDTTVVAMTTQPRIGEWVDGKLVFHNVPVDDVLRALRHWYGYTFKLTDATLAREQVTVEFDAADRAKMFRQLQQLLHVSMVFDDSVVTLRPVLGSQAGHEKFRNNKRDGFNSHSEVGR